MSSTIVSTPAKAQRSKVPYRDWILLPLIALTTIALIVGVSELVARRIWSEQDTDSCYVANGPTGGRFRPNCKSKIKAVEGPWVEDSYNSCGYRSLESCGPKPPGTIRIALLGSSYSFGYGVPYQATFTTVSAEMLRRECRRPVEVQNLGVPNLPLENSYYRTGEALGLNPDLLLLSIGPWDVSNFVHFDPDATNGRQYASHEAKKNVHDWRHVKSSRAFIMLQHYMFRDPATFARVYLTYGDAADYLRTPFSPLWQQRFSNLEIMLRDMSEKAHAASVPIALLVTPTEVQAALVNTPPRAGVTPEAFVAEITRIASKYGIAVIDPLPDFAGQRDPMDMFYIFDGHTGPRGQRVVAGTLNKAILSGKFPAFAGCN
jgi:hypothetical protein